MRERRYEWHLVLKVPQGHRYMRATNHPETRIGMADSSGPNPEQTDDGLLWLDTTRPVILGWFQNHSAHIPLVRDDGSRAGTGETNAGALRVAREFGMKVAIDPGAKELAEFLRQLVEYGLDKVPALLAAGAAK